MGKSSDKRLLDIQKHNAQYPLISVIEFDRSHDRFLCIDETVYHLGASIKDLGKKWFAFNRMEMPTTELLKKIWACVTTSVSSWRKSPPTCCRILERSLGWYIAAKAVICYLQAVGQSTYPNRYIVYRWPVWQQVRRWKWVFLYPNLENHHSPNPEWNAAHSPPIVANGAYRHGTACQSS